MCPKSSASKTKRRAYSRSRGAKHVRHRMFSSTSRPNRFTSDIMTSLTTFSGLLKYQSATHSCLHFFSSSTKKTWHVKQRFTQTCEGRAFGVCPVLIQSKKTKTKQQNSFRLSARQNHVAAGGRDWVITFLTQTRLCFVQTVPCALLARTHATVCCCAWTSALSSTNLSVKLTCVDQTSALLKTLHETCERDGRYKTYLSPLSWLGVKLSKAALFQKTFDC